MVSIRYILTGVMVLCSSVPFFSTASPKVNCEQFNPEQLTRIRYLSADVTTPQVCESQSQRQTCSNNQLSGWSGHYHYLSCREISADGAMLPRMSMGELIYRGGFRLSSKNAGPSSYATLSYSPGVMTYNSVNHSLFIAGNPYEGAIAEFAIPEVVNSPHIENFVVGENVLQPFAQFHNTDRVDTGIAGTLRINGLQLIDGQLLVNYMAPRDTNDTLKKTTVVFTDHTNVAESHISGPYELNGALHASGWLSAIPDHWQSQLGGTHISGAPGPTFIWKTSPGPTAFAFNPRQHMLSGQAAGPVASNQLLDFSFQKLLQEPLRHSDNLSNSAILANQNGLNDLWTITSHAAYGVIIPDTSTYLTIGYSSGHQFGIGSGVKQDTGRFCNSPCPLVDGDRYAYYWLWDVNDLISVKNGKKQASELLPYDHGKFDVPIGYQITGGTFDDTSGSLYLALSNADKVPRYARPPLFLKYQLESSISGYDDCSDIPHGRATTRERFERSEVEHDQQCISEQQTAVCHDGRLENWSGSYQSQSCKVLLPPSPTKDLVNINILEYAGGFRITAKRFGNEEKGSADFSPGIMAYNSDNNSLFLVGNRLGGYLAEFAIPELVKSSDFRQFNVIRESLQDFTNFQKTERVDTGIPGHFRYTGLAVIQGQLVANYINNYDAHGTETDTSIVIKNANDLANSEVSGPYQLSGKMNAAGWISAIPENWQGRLAGTYISGNQSLAAINSALSVGPSAFVFNPEQDLLATEPGSVDTLGLLDFPLRNMLYDKSVYGESINNRDYILYNQDGNNDLWNILAGASYGFIVPGTDTYMTLGRIGGLESRIAYKQTQSNGHVCGGPCAYEPDDSHNYYWLWNVNDLLKVKKGQMLSYDVRPYEYGKFDIPVNLGRGTISGGTYDSNNQVLYLSFKEADTLSNYVRPPVFLAFKVNY